MKFSIATIALVMTLMATPVGSLRGVLAQPPAGMIAAPKRYIAPSPDKVREQALAWVHERIPSAEVKAAAEQLWGAPVTKRDELLDRLADTFALADSRAKQLVDACRKPRDLAGLPDIAWLDSDDIPPFERDHLRMYYGRWLAHERLYDESLEALEPLEPSKMVDPASLLFFQAVAHHRLLHKEDGLRTLDQLATDVAEVPHRYVALAELMKFDLKDLDDESLDHIARRMEDIERRLGLGRSGQRVVKIEDGVIESLDKLIEELEKQRQQQQGGGGGGGMQPSQPMPDSRIARAQGAGKTDRKPLGDGAGWGDLPAKQREEAMQQIGKDFPAHYREVIEQYFRRLASEGAER